MVLRHRKSNIDSELSRYGSWKLTVLVVCLLLAVGYNVIAARAFLLPKGDRRPHQEPHFAAGSSQNINMDDEKAPFRRRSTRVKAQQAQRLLLKSNEGNAQISDMKKPSNDTPCFTMGVIADIQYAPIPNGFSYSGVPRYYEHSLLVAKHAAEHFEKEQVSLVLNLGDTIDGKCQNIEGNGGKALPPGIHPGHQSLDNVIKALSAYTIGPILHTYGNHELYNLERAALGLKLGIPFFREEPSDELVGYRSFIFKSVRFIMLDSYDIAIAGRCHKTSVKRQQACDILSQNNPNYPDSENSPEGLKGLKRRFVAFNGAVGEKQLEWLEQELQAARTARQKVLVSSHQPIHPGSTKPICLIWNYSEVLSVLRRYQDVVVASFSGHAHRGGYKRDKSGIHFRVFEAALENPPPHKTYAMLDVHDDCLVVRGFGNCESAIYDFEHCSFQEAPYPQPTKEQRIL